MNNDANFPSAVGEAFEYGYLRWRAQEYWDDSFVFIERAKLSLAERNEFYRETLDWETAPALKIVDWTTPVWKPRGAAELSDPQVSLELLKVATRLYELGHVVYRADHLSDRRLYNLILKHVLNGKEVKRLKRRARCCWNFCGYAQDASFCAPMDELFEYNELAFYATDDERFDWAAATGRKLPPKKMLARRDFFPFNVAPEF